MIGAVQRNNLLQRQKLVLLILTIFFSLVCAELVLRAEGYEPLGPVQQQYQSIEPGGRFLELDSPVGYSLIPGAYKITFIDGYTFQVTHSSDRLRITHPLNDSVTEKDAVWILGDSFTYGWELNDAETYPWLLQNALPEFEIVNFGVPGNGTVQSYLQIQDALQRRTKPKIIVLAYASFHDERNTLARTWRKYFPVPVNSQGDVYLPVARLDQQGNARYGVSELEYREFPLVRSLALANLIDNIYNIQVDRYQQPSHAVTKAVIKDLYNAATQNQARFVLAGIYSDPLTQEMLQFANAQGIETVDISVPVDPPTFFPDAHPRANANLQFAQKLLPRLSR